MLILYILDMLSSPNASEEVSVVDRSSGLADALLFCDGSSTLIGSTVQVLKKVRHSSSAQRQPFLSIETRKRKFGKSDESSGNLQEINELIKYCRQLTIKCQTIGKHEKGGEHAKFAGE